MTIQNDQEAMEGPLLIHVARASNGGLLVYKDRSYWGKGDLKITVYLMELNIQN